MAITFQREQSWIFRQDIDREFLRSFSGFLKIAQMVSLATGFAALLHFIKVIAKTTGANLFFLLSTAVTLFLNLTLFVVLVFNIEKKITSSTKTWNILLSMYTFIIAVLLLVPSTLLLLEAIELGDSFSSGVKCEKCSKINIAVVFGFVSWILFTVDFFLYLRQCGCLDIVNQREARRVIAVQPAACATRLKCVEPRTFELSENEREQTIRT